jgi:hypothetical protein
VQLTNLRYGDQDQNVTWQADTRFKPSPTGNDELVLYASDLQRGACRDVGCLG